MDKISKIMGGWKTWVAAAGTAALGIVEIANGDVGKRYHETRCGLRTHRHRQ